MVNWLAEMVEEVQERFPRSTAARRAVIEAVLGKEGHFSAEEMCQEMRGVGRATVYRTLAALQEQGLVCRVLLEDGELRYRRSPESHHHHVVCVVCGQVQDITGCGVDDFVQAIAARFGYSVAGHRLEIYGRCGRCKSL
ncbi:MAG: transcriptional repressor [Chloroflexi bacterium]|nr:transcriptional repressor [Chloroflexota bacterium]